MSVFRPKTPQSTPAVAPKQSSHTGSYWGSFYMVGAMLCFTLMGILIKQTSLEFGLHAYELVFWRVVFALVVLGVQARILGQSFATAYPKAHFGRSFMGTMSLFAFFYGITQLPLATAVTFSNTSAIFLAIFSIVLLKQKPNGLTWVALVVGLLGVVLILRPTVLYAGLLPTLIGLVSGVLAGYAYLMVKELSVLGEPSWRIVFYFSLVATVLSAAASTLVGWTPLQVGSVGYLLGIGVSAMIGQLLMTHAYKVGKKFMVASLSYLGVVLSTLYGAVGFGEVLPVMAFVGIGLVVISGVLAGIK